MTPAALAVALSLAAAPAPEKKGTLYAFFATWCIPCRVELPFVEALHRQYGDQGLDVVLVSEDAPSTAANLPSFLARFGATARLVIDTDSELLVRYHPAASIPFVVLVDASGAVRYAHAGYEPGDERALQAAVMTLMTATADPTEEPSLYDATSSSQGLGVFRRSRFSPRQDGDLQAAIARLEAEGHYGVTDDQGCHTDPGCGEARVRVDGAVVSDEVGGDDEDLRLERATLTLGTGGFRVRGGDTYAAFGKGVALSLRRVDPLGQDTALRGGRFDYGGDRFGLTVVGGVVNPQNVDPLLFRVIDHTDDKLAGAQARVALGESAHVAPYFLLAEAPEASPNIDRQTGRAADIQWGLGGASAAASLWGVDIALDGAAGVRSGFGAEDDTAWALYSAWHFDAGETATLVETKTYRHWEIGRREGTLLYHEPPTLEREDQEVPSNADVFGARVRTEWRTLETLTTYANVLGYGYTEDGTDPLGPGGELALHGYLGADWRPTEAATVALAGGYRIEIDEDRRQELAAWHVDADASWSVSPNLALTAKINHRTETKVSFPDDKTFVEGLGIVGISMPQVIAVSALLGYSTEADTLPTAYPAGEIRVTLPKGGEARLFFGRLRGGRVCVSGSCRDLPPFEGVRLDVVLRL